MALSIISGVMVTLLLVMKIHAQQQHNGKFVMVIGGERTYGTEKSRINDIEIVSFDSANDGIPVICGGCIHMGDDPPGDTSSCQNTDICWKYIPTYDTWEEIGNLNSLAGHPAYDYTESFGFAIAEHEGSTFQVTQDGVNFDILAPYPNADVEVGGFGTNDDGCLVVLDDKNAFLAGGRIKDDAFSPRSFLYNRDVNEWRELASMPQGRKLHSCGVVDSFSGYSVIVAGSEEYPNAADQPREFSVDIYDIRSDTWIPGTNLPFGIAAATSVRTEQSFAIVGGHSSELNQEHDTIFMYQPQDYTWMELPGKLKTPRSESIAIAVDISIFPQCSNA